MAAPSIGDVQLVVSLALEVYNKIQDAEDEIKQAGIMMENLESYLRWLRKILDAKVSVAAKLDPHWKELMERISQRMVQMKKTCQGIHRILKIFHDHMPMSKFVFPFGKNPKILRGSMEDLQRHRDFLAEELGVVPLLGSATSTVGSGGLAVPAAPPIARPLPPPSPKPVKKDCRIICIDPHNVGRSKVAETYSHLLGVWTISTGKKWPVKFVHSAGMAVKSRSDCTETMQKLKYPVPLAAGNQPPTAVAMDSLLDNKYYNTDVKTALREQMMKSRSRGVNSNVFQLYDFILVFVQREFTSLLALRKALVAAHGQQIAPKGKGRIIHLGSYLSKDGNPMSIVDAKKNEEGEHTRAEWNKTTSQIKLAMKAFMKEELDWSEPPKAPLPNASK